MYEFIAAESIPPQIARMVVNDLRKIEAGKEAVFLYGAGAPENPDLRILFLDAEGRDAFRRELTRGKLQYAKSFFIHHPQLVLVVNRKEPFVVGDLVRTRRSLWGGVRSICGEALFVHMESRRIKDIRYKLGWQLRFNTGDNWFLADDFELDFAPYPEAA